MPRNIDEFNAQVISRASRIVMVVQQSLPHIQDATRLQQLLRDQLGISSDNLLVVVNRYNKRAEIQLADIEKALPGSEVVTVPNQYKEVSESINLGIPMYEYARHSAVTRALVCTAIEAFRPRKSERKQPRQAGFRHYFRNRLCTSYLEINNDSGTERSSEKSRKSPGRE